MTSPRFPRMFGKYALLRPFARGGMGEIYLAAHGELGGAEKLCLVKKVPDDRDAPGLTARLLDEAKVAVRLNHTNLVQVFDAGRVDDELYIAMELIEGRDLRAVWNRTAERRSRIPLDVALFVVREIARGLDYAHNYGGLGLVHRDIAPPNILLSFHGEVKVTDFGLARSILKNEKTAPGIVYGRIAYLAPEQARGEQADARTDIFATGVILWELLTGRPLRDTTDDAVKNLDQARHPRIEAPSHLARGLPSSIDAVSLKALAPDREPRYQTADDLRKAVADELARIAPATDASRVAAFLKDLFGDEIKREQADRERLLREELPKLRAQRAGRERAQARVEARPPAPSTTERKPAPSTTERKAPPRPSLPGRLPTSPPRPPPLRALLRQDSDLDDDEETVAAPHAATMAPAPALSISTAPRDDSGEIAGQRINPEALVGLVIDGRYRIERVLGTGGMGAVYEAEHIEIGKRVALKVLHPQFSRQADLVARFRREARAASRVGHPNIVDVTDSGTTPDGDVYFVMERLDGLDLGEVLRHERRVAPDRVVTIGTQVCRALSAAHAAGIIHRDLKPENIFLVSREGVADFVKVLDFGIAKQDLGNQNGPRRLTTPGIAMGTPEYMAPEQAAGKAIDGRVDIYSVGAILYEMLTGDPPHHGDNVMEVLARKATEAPTRPTELNPAVPEALEAVVMACLERDPDRRPQTMGALEYELNKSMRGRGSAVAAVLGLKGADEGLAPSGWSEETSRPHRFDTGAVPQRRGSMPSFPSVRGTAPAAKPSEPAPPPGPTARPASTVEPTANGHRQPAPPAPSWGRPLGWLGAAAVLSLVGVGAYNLRREPTVAPPPAAPARTSRPAPAPTSSKVNPTPPAAPTQTKASAPTREEGAMSPAEIDRMLEWARRTAEGGRFTSPPGDNLKELLERIDRADPGNAQAQALKQHTVALLAKKGAHALKREHLDDAEESFRALLALDPHDDGAKGRLASTLVRQAKQALERQKLQTALAKATQALELRPEQSTTLLTMADVHLAMGKRELAAGEYQRVLDLKPKDKHAKAGLARAKQPAKKSKHRHRRHGRR